ncbi:hypothetical protein SAMN05216390_101257 [Lachnospiraceae bacterium KH1T2]|nr:hypothetical protein SAMN05216390_101257 [Lachnospiraceae bacterium KH1T2]
MLTAVLIINFFLAIGIVMFINGIIFRKSLPIPLIVVLIIGGSFITIAAAMCELFFVIMKA